MPSSPTAPALRGPYELLHRLGEGGMGTVWLARHRASQDLVALKILSDEDARIKARFRREIAILKQLDHPGIVPLLDHGVEHDGELWFAMKLLRGEPLSAHIRRALKRPSSLSQGDEGASSRWTTRLSQIDKLLEQHVPPAQVETSSALPSRLTPRLERASALREALATTISALRDGTLDAEISSASLSSDHPLLRPEAPEPPAASRSPRPWPHRATLELLTYILQLCPTLAALHGEGIVHCDIKPENIVITQEGLTVVVDLGIAERFGARVEHDVLEGAGLKAGTAAYIAPEQIRGEPVDARTDLYALGCMLYEILSGSPPFCGGTPTSVLLRHLATPPKPLCELDAQIPRELEALCAQLLAKAPAERLGHALGVASRLAPYAPSPRAFKRPPEPPKPYLHKARLTGREALIEALDATLRSTLCGQGAASITLGGESGVGKSSVAAELIGRARHRQVTVLSARCQPQRGAAQRHEPLAGSPLHAFEPLLQQIVDVALAARPEPSALRAAFAPHLRALTPYSHAMRSLRAQHSQAFEGLAPLGAQKARAHLGEIVSSLHALLAAYSGGRAMLLLFDDVHGADELSIQALIGIKERARQRQERWLVLAFYASDEAPERLGALLTASGWVHRRIARLDESAIATLCAEMLGVEAPSEALVAHLHAQAQGNPFFVAEYLRLAMERGQLERDGEGRWQVSDEESLRALPTPSSVEQLITSRLERLPGEAEWLCLVASVYDDTFCGEAIAPIWRERQGAGVLEETLELLVRREILEDEELTHTYRFAHERLRHSSYERLGEGERQRVHAAAAEALERLKAPIEQIASQRERAGQLDQAAADYWQGAELATQRFALEQARALFARGLALRDAHGAAHAERRLAHVRHVLIPMRALDEAEAELDALLKIARLHELDALRARALTLLARTCMHQQQVARAERLLDEAASRFEALASGQGKADTLYQLARLKLEVDQIERAHELADQARSTYLRIKDRRGQARALLLLIETCWRLSRRREAESIAEQAEALHTRLDHLRGLARATTWLARIAEDAGRHQAMARHIERARELHTRLDDPSGLAQVAILSARQARRLGDLAGARRRLDHALSQLERTHDPELEAIALKELRAL